MSISTETGGINIKDLVIENPIKEDPIFDPKTEIPPDIKQQIIEMVRKEGERTPRVNFDWSFLLTLAKYARILFHEELNSELISEESLPELRKYLLDYLDEVGNHAMIARLADAKLTSPKSVRKLDILGWEEFHQNLVRIGLNPSTRESYGSLLAEGRILFPEQTSTIAISQHLKPRMLKILKFAKGGIELGYDNFLHYAYQFRLLFPDEKVTQFADKETQRVLIDLFRTIDPAQNLVHYIRIAALLTILTAEEIKVGDQGLEIIQKPKTSLSEPTSELPEKRRF